MKYLKLFGVGLVAMFTLALTASSSFAQLPDVSIALGGTYPLHLSVTLLNVRTELQTTAAQALKGSGLLLLLLTEQLTSLGSFEVLFTSVLNPGGASSCISENGTTKDASGLVLTLGTFHIVLVPPHGSLGILFLVQPLKIICGGITVHVRGSVLSLITNATGTEGTEYTGLTGELKAKSGEAGVPEVTEYINEGGTIVKANLESDFGSEFVSSAEVVETTVTATALEGKMFVIKPR
jgi:hypothetical protein